MPNIKKLACVVPEKNVTEFFCDANADDAKRQKWSLYVVSAKGMYCVELYDILVPSIGTLMVHRLARVTHISHTNNCDIVGDSIECHPIDLHISSPRNFESLHRERPLGSSIRLMDRLIIPHATSCGGYNVLTRPSISQSVSPSVLFFLLAQLWNRSTEFRETLKIWRT